MTQFDKIPSIILGALLLSYFPINVTHAGNHDAIESWQINTQQEWTEHLTTNDAVNTSDGLVSTTSKSVTIRSVLKSFPEKRSAASIVVSQSSIWENWESAGHIGPKNLADAPVLLRHGPNDYWIFGKYRKSQKKCITKLKGKKCIDF